MAPLDVATTGNPAFTTSRALATSHALGRTSGRNPRWRRRSACAWSILFKTARTFVLVKAHIDRLSADGDSVTAGTFGKCRSASDERTHRLFVSHEFTNDSGPGYAASGCHQYWCVCHRVFTPSPVTRRGASVPDRLALRRAPAGSWRGPRCSRVPARPSRRPWDRAGPRRRAGSPSAA